MNKNKKSKRTPARIRYDEEHPTASFRIDRELYEQLMTVKEKEGKSIADVLRIGVGILTVKVREESEIKEEAYVKGYHSGYKKAESLYKITLRCYICKETTDIKDETTKKAVKRYLEEEGWAHQDCIDRTR